MKIIFVGLHNKPDIKPLDRLTKTGQLIHRIILGLPKDTEVVKSNLFEIDYFPHFKDMLELKNEWYWKYNPDVDDIIVLLGQTVHKEFNCDIGKILKVAHPASKYSHKAMDEYVTQVIVKIIELIK